MSIALFRRGLEWRKEANERLEKRRQELLAAEGSRPMQFGSRAATVGEHVDSYWEYRRLVGESDGGTLLSEEAYAELRRLAAKAARNRLYVTWRNVATGMDCYCIGPDSRCFCGHSYKAHAWFNTESKRVHCRCGGCACEQFEYVTGHGAWWIKCTCKHGHHEHECGRGRCAHPACGCRRFHSSFSCVCGASWAEHATTVETRAERAASGRPTHNLCGGGGVGEAAGGALTRMASLIPGIDRIETPLPFTDAGFFAHRLPSADGGVDGGGDADDGSRGDGGGGGAYAGRGGGSASQWTRQALVAALPDESFELLCQLLGTEETREEETREAEVKEAEATEVEAEPMAAGAALLSGGGFGREAASRRSSPAGAAAPQAAAAGVVQPHAGAAAAPRSQGGGRSRIGGRSGGRGQPAAASRSATITAHDEELRRQIHRLKEQIEAPETSAATRHGLKRQLAAKQAALKRDVVPALAGR